MQILHSDFQICSWWLGVWGAWILESDLSSDPTIYLVTLEYTLHLSELQFCICKRGSFHPPRSVVSLQKALSAPDTSEHPAVGLLYPRYCLFTAFPRFWELSLLLLRVRLTPNPPSIFFGFLKAINYTSGGIPDTSGRTFSFPGYPLSSLG